jgi:hypothetical protein
MGIFRCSSVEIVIFRQGFILAGLQAKEDRTQESFQHPEFDFFSLKLFIAYPLTACC